ncbi:hypothetical protein C1H46_007037 [Malus baccata]|uniref:PORR domain-containing protein n=1 Tax=Malus baccata TaxID=106549 RepID=A0A540N8K5_MALBA|nr:hypothetical protein C1H46_007037 [Malus baccata]
MAMSLIRKLPHRFNTIRTFVNAKVKWVRDPYLDYVVEREKDLKQSISLKNQILSNPSQSLPLSAASLLKPHLDLPTTSSKFFHKYPSFFSIFQPSPGFPPHVKLTPQILSLHKEESAIHTFMPNKYNAIERLSKVLMLTRGTKLPMRLINRLKWDLGLPHDIVGTLLADFPDYFQVCEVEDAVTGKLELALGLVCWRKELAFSQLEKRAIMVDLSEKMLKHIAFPMNFPKGFDLDKRVKDWVEEWQRLPYISPYENAAHLSANSDQAEKWTVAVLHEVLWLMVSKKTERENLYVLGEYLGFERSRLKKAVVHHPGIFYVSNKIRTQTVVLREAYRKNFLIEKHPLMGIQYRHKCCPGSDAGEAGFTFSERKWDVERTSVILETYRKLSIFGKKFSGSLCRGKASGRVVMEEFMGFTEESRDNEELGISKSSSSSPYSYKLVPWLSWDEWLFVDKSLFSNSPDFVASALRRISTWRSRGCLPITIEVTASIIEIQRKDPHFRKDQSNDALDNSRTDQSIDASLSEEMLAMLYCMAIMRLVNGVVEKTRKKTEVSIAVAADAIGIPRTLIDVRHEGSHRELPALDVVRTASVKALHWLKCYYWEPQKKEIPFHGNETDNIRNEIRSKLHELAFCLRVKTTPQSHSSNVKKKRGMKFAFIQVILIIVTKSLIYIGYNIF